MFFSVMTKNLNWEISTKNLKDRMGLMIKSFHIMAVQWKIRGFFWEGGGAWKKIFLGGGESPKKGGLDSL